MKAFSLLSVIAATFAFSSYAQAATVPGPSVDIHTCLESAKTMAAKDRCYAIDNCTKNESGNREELRECLFKAEETYRAAQGATETGAPPLEEYSAVPPAQIQSPVATEAADSAYSVKGGDQKGWENSTQGD